MSKRRARLAWFERRLALWWEQRELIGASEARLGLLEERIGRANELREAAERACVEARAASEAWREAAAAVERQGKRVLAEIREVAAEDPGVWALAGIKPKDGEAEGGPRPPRNVEVERCGAGVRLRWEGDAGAMYVLERRLGGQSGFRLLGATSEREYHDIEGLAGGGEVAYRLLAQLGGRISAYSEVMVVEAAADGDDLALAA